MDAKEMLEIYKKHERNTRPDLAALLTIAEILAAIHEEHIMLKEKFEVLP